MSRIKNFHILFLLIVTAFLAFFPQERSAVLCFSGEGNFSIREKEHSLCSEEHSDFEISKEEIHDHHHCNDVNIPSVAAKKRNLEVFAVIHKLVQVFYSSPATQIKSFKSKKIKKLLSEENYNLAMLSKVVFIC